MVLLFRDFHAIVCLNLKEKFMLNQLPCDLYGLGFPVAHNKRRVSWGSPAPDR